ncbi:MAG: HAD family phosphatase [Pacificimonas sp.]
MSGKAAVIFDFDGVVVDSEILSNDVFADVFSAAGFPMTAEDAITRYIGKRFADCVPLIEAHYGKTVDPALDDAWRDGVLARLDTDLDLVPGVRQFMASLDIRPRAIASSSDPEWLHAMLARFDLAHHIGEHVYSGARDVAKGKPEPDLYLHAADKLGVPPNRCFVIEDSPTGVEAGARAGMHVCGLLAGGHAIGGHSGRLSRAGAHVLANSYDDVATHLKRFEGTLR